MANKEYFVNVLSFLMCWLKLFIVTLLVGSCCQWSAGKKLEELGEHGGKLQ
jgi:hypothetical protein